ncbi:MAG: haloacid dehalogenase type II [Sporichthyaceae bacterium]|nr:haloacid dehalogenase type II [Sporichthyaceae bacterium]
MAHRPLVVAFDVIETLFPLEPMRVRLARVGQPADRLELWFARILRDAFALTAADGYRPFGEVAASALASVTKDALSDAEIEEILAGFRDLDPHPDVEPAIRAVRDAGVRAITLTNGSASNTAALLDRAGLGGYVEKTVSVDEVRRWKPAAEPYRHAADVCGVLPDRMAMVAAHGWDVHGARQAGLVTAWVSRLEGRLPAVFDPADVSGPGLIEVVRELLALPQE